MKSSVLGGGVSSLRDLTIPRDGRLSKAMRSEKCRFESHFHRSDV